MFIYIYINVFTYEANPQLQMASPWPGEELNLENASSILSQGKGCPAGQGLSRGAARGWSPGEGGEIMGVPP